MGKDEIIYRLTEREVLKEKRKYYLYKTIRNLSSLFLSPLLAIAVWFLFLQIGIRNEQQLSNNSGIFLLATVSFTIGLITNEVIQRLTEFAKNSLGIGRNDDIKSTKTILIDNYNIESNDKEVKITFEIPEIEKEDIMITANDNKLQVKINDHEKKDVKIIELPKEVDIETARSTYKNGKLEIIFKRNGNTKSSNKEISVDD